MPLAPGTRFGTYEILSPIGAGGMGEVFRAKDVKLGREVAIKILPPGVARDAERLARFEREAKVLAALNHPNIAHIYGFEENGDTRALAMELVPGSTLTVPQPLETALNYAKQIADAVEAAHEKGFTHRDLKPANIMITPDGIVKVLDFGLAAIPHRESDSDPNNSPTMTMAGTQAGTIMGTAAYMSPEQAAGRAVDKRSDIWSFGVVLYEMLTGRRLFDGETASHTLASVLKEEIDFDLPAVPAPIQALLRRCLERNPKLRLRDIGEARLAIEAHLRNPAVVTHSPAKRPVVWMAATGLALLAAAIFAWLWLRASETTVAPLLRFELQEQNVSSFSPNGRWILGRSPTGLRVRSLTDGERRTLPGTEGAHEFLFWSGDSRSVGFVSGDRLRTISLDGPAPRDLGPAPEYRGGTWRGGAEDGTIVFAAGNRMRAIDLRSRQIRDLPLVFAPNAGPRRPVFLPEGDGFVFEVRGAPSPSGDPAADRYQLVRASLNAADMTPLLTTRAQVSFARNPRTQKWHMFYLSGDEDDLFSRVLLTVPIDPRTAEFLSKPVKLLEGLRASENTYTFSAGGGVAFWRMAGRSLPVWRLTWFDFSGKLLGRIGEKSNFSALSLSPDESAVAVQDGFPVPHIWIYNAKTGVGRRLSTLPDFEMNPHWAPDGKSVYFFTRPPGGKTQLVRHSVDSNGGREVMWEGAGVRAYLLGISPDERYAIVVSDQDVSRIDLHSPAPRQWEDVFKGLRVHNLKLSPDGRSVAYAGESGTYLSQFPPNGQPSFRVADSALGLEWIFFSTDGATLYGANGRNLFAYAVSTNGRVGEAQMMFPLAHIGPLYSQIAAASRDGKRILAIATDDPAASSPQVISDWTTLLPPAP